MSRVAALLRRYLDFALYINTAWLGAGMIWLSVFLINTMSSWRRQERRLNELAEQQHGSEQRVRFLSG